VSAITTHVLDTARGRPAAGVHVVLERASGDGQWEAVGRGATDADGRLGTLLPDATTVPGGVYRLVFETGAYFDAQGVPSFHPSVTVTFDVPPGDAHCHVPLLVSPYGYTTYRGS
jgi:5-hydroxyisourate hydrolase